MAITWKYYQGRKEGKTWYFHLPAHSEKFLHDVYYRPQDGWAYFLEISQETYLQHVPLIVLQQLEPENFS